MNEWKKGWKRIKESEELCILLVFGLIALYLFSAVETFAEKSSKLNQQQGESVDDSLQDAMCGPKSLSLLCEMFGVSISPEKIAKLSNVTQEGVSIKGLADAAHQLGLKAVGMKIPVEELLQIKRPVIAHLYRNHFVVVESIKEKQLRLFDPGGSDQIMSPAEFKEIWSGHVLAISPENIGQENAPKIEIEQPIFDFGEASQEQIISHDFILKNSGNAPLEIERVRQSCVCTVAVPSKKVVPPGETTQIQVKYDTKHSRGRQVAHIAIHTNDPNKKVTFVTITGIVAGLIRVSPNQIYLGDIHFNETVHKVIEVYDPGHGKLLVKKVFSSTPFFQIEVNERKGGELVATIDVTINPGLPLGEVHEKISIETNDPKFPKTEVLVKGTVIGDIELSPKQFFLGFVKRGDTAKRTVKLTKKGKPNLKILKIENQSKSIVIKVVPVKPGQEYEIQAICTPSSSEALIRDMVKVHTNNVRQPLFEVPIYGIVQ